LFLDDEYGISFGVNFVLEVESWFNNFVALEFFFFKLSVEQSVLIFFLYSLNYPLRNTVRLRVYE
jgi:hypothetical protein